MTTEISKNTAELVRNKLAKIDERLKKMEIAKNAGPRTNGIFNWNGRSDLPTSGNGGAIKIDQVLSIALLISILGFLMTRKEEYDKAAERLDINPFPVFVWSKYPLDAWENDIKAQISLITHSSEIERLTKLKTELSKYVSEEDRVMDLLKELED
jgi:hypothetical protein